MLEKHVERALVKEAQKHGLLCWKFVSPSVSGVADRILIGNTGDMGFIEVKRPGGKRTPLQLRFAQQMLDRGQFYMCVENPDQAKAAIQAFLIV